MPSPKIPFKREPSPPPFHLVILGPQGSGKGTQAHLLSSSFKMPHLSAGELIRKEIKEKTPLGKKIKAIHNQGRLISPLLMKKMFEKALSSIPLKQTIIFEGYPRTKEQIKDFEDLLEKRKIKGKKVILLKIKEKTTLNRLLGRRFCPSCEKNFYPPESFLLSKCPKCGEKIKKRPDDQKEVIKKRLSIYQKEIQPVISYFKRKGELLEINGEPSIEEVNKEIIKGLS